MIQVPKNNRFLKITGSEKTKNKKQNKKQVRVGNPPPKKEVEPIAPNSEAESQTKYTTYIVLDRGQNGF